MMNEGLEAPSDNGGVMGQLSGHLSRKSPFRRPGDVVRATGLSVDEKRAILASWASDLYAVESRPTLRFVPEWGIFASIDDLQSALEDLDRNHEA